MTEEITPPTRRAGSGAVRQAGTLAAGLLVGLVIAYVAFGRGGSTPLQAASNADAPPITLAEAPPADIPPGGEPATDPRAAITAFLQAESEGDFLASFGLLAAGDRAAYVTPARWQAGHEAIPPVVGFELRPGGDGPTVDVLLRLRAGLDGVLGLVPAEATSTWTAVAEDGGWRVDFGATTVQPRLLDDSGVAPAAAEWAAARQDCTDGVREHGTLVGTTGLADDLCGVTSVAPSATASALPAVDAARFVSAYGPDATTWARVVAIDGTVPLRAVLAPIDDRWVVIGVLSPAL
ncbi:MAG: hypothetical protein H0W25_02140 [Acidimicrobiia bacterium]|nr:hypothetical protein [Acidimicrobiia bacterium]